MMIHLYNIAVLLLCQCIISHAFHATSTPPLLDVPVFSLSTLGGASKSSDNDHAKSTSSTMNILTYASPVSITPHRMWSISLYKGTLSHENFAREKRGILQLLTPQHSSCKGESEIAGELIRVLGGSSGNDVDKRLVCEELGYAWEKLPNEKKDDDHWSLVLPSCVYYLKLELVGDDMIDCGSHEVALCKVVSMISNEEIIDPSDELDSLSTRSLRNDSIISELGRVVPIVNTT